MQELCHSSTSFHPPTPFCHEYIVNSLFKRQAGTSSTSIPLWVVVVAKNFPICERNSPATIVVNFRKVLGILGVFSFSLSPPGFHSLIQIKSQDTTFCSQCVKRTLIIRHRISREERWRGERNLTILHFGNWKHVEHSYSRSLLTVE